MNSETETTELEIGLIQKSSGTVIRVTLKEYRNNCYVDIREFRSTELDTGPTKRGIRFLVDDWDAFFDVIKSVDDEIKLRF